MIWFDVLANGRQIARFTSRANAEMFAEMKRGLMPSIHYDVRETLTFSRFR